MEAAEYQGILYFIAFRVGSHHAKPHTKGGDPMSKTFDIKALVRVAVLGERHREVIDEIVREEMEHLVTLSKVKKALGT
jgi:hypothetical protein